MSSGMRGMCISPGQGLNKTLHFTLIAGNLFGQPGKTIRCNQQCIALGVAKSQEGNNLY